MGVRAYNSDHGMQIDTERVKQASEFLKGSLQEIRQCETKDQLRGYEGEAAKLYFRVLMR